MARVVNINVDLFGVPAGDIEIERVTFTQARGECGIITLDCVLGPQGGGTYVNTDVTITATLDDDTLINIAKGKTTGFPVGLAGDVITLEAMCRAQDYAKLIDALYAPHDAALSPHVDSTKEKRRSEPFLPLDVYQNPWTHACTFEPIDNAGGQLFVLRGHGSAPGASDIVSLSHEISDDPLFELEQVVESSFDELSVDRVNLSSQFAPIQTATPTDFVAQVSGLSGQSGDSMHILSSRAVLTSTIGYMHTNAKARIEPMTCTMWPKSTAFHTVRTYSIDMSAAVRTDQRRRELAEINYKVGVVSIGGTSQSSTFSVSDPDELARYFATFSRDTGQIINGVHVQGSQRFRCVRDSVFSAPKTGGGREIVNKDVLTQIIGGGVKECIERAYGVRVSVMTPVSSLIGATLKDRVRIHDDRLPGGMCEGRIVAIEFAFADSDYANVTVACCANGLEEMIGEEITDALHLGDSDIRVFIEWSEDPDAPMVNGQRSMALANLASAFVESVTVTGTFTSTQKAEIDAITAQNNLTPSATEQRLTTNDISRLDPYLTGTEIDVQFATDSSGDAEFVDNLPVATVHVVTQSGIQL